MIDFRLEAIGDPVLYTQVMRDWGYRVGYGLIGRCPGCGRFVRFGVTDKQPINDPGATGLPLLPDDWHQNAFIA